MDIAVVGRRPPCVASVANVAVASSVLSISREGVGRHDALTIPLVEGNGVVDGRRERVDQAGGLLGEDVAFRMRLSASPSGNLKAADVKPARR